MRSSTGYAVIGLGLFGSAIARTLAEMGHHVLAIDQRLALVEAIGPSVAEAVQADAMDRAALGALRIERFEVVFNTIGDLSASILCTLALRELGVRRIVAKINSPQQGRILSRLGAEVLLFPERDMGERVARQIALPSSVISQTPLGTNAALLEMPAPRSLVGQTLASAGVRQRWGVTVIAVKPGGGAEVIVSPAPDLTIGEGDIVMVAGEHERLALWQQSTS